MRTKKKVCCSQGGRVKVYWNGCNASCLRPEILYNARIKFTLVYPSLVFSVPCIHWKIYCPLIRLIMVVHPQVSSPGPVPPIGLAPCHDLVTAFHHKVLMVITPWISSCRYWYHSLEFVGERLIGSNSSLTACPCVIPESSTWSKKTSRTCQHHSQSRPPTRRPLIPLEGSPVPREVVFCVNGLVNYLNSSRRSSKSSTVVTPNVGYGPFFRTLRTL